MNHTILLVLLVVVAFVGGHFFSRNLSRFVTISALQYALIGVLAGPTMPWAFITQADLAALSPAISLVLGLLGFLLGLGAREAIRRTEDGLAGLLAGLGVSILVGLLLLPVLALVPMEGALFVLNRTIPLVPGWALSLSATSTHLMLAAVLGTIASAASVPLIGRVITRLGAEGRVCDFTLAAAAASQVAAVVLVGFTLASVRAARGASGLDLTVAEWELAAAGVGVACGLLFSLFIGRERDPSRILLATLGLTTFASGVGEQLGLSPLFVNLVAGGTVAATSPHRHEVLAGLKRLQHPLFVLAMLFGGLHWQPVHGVLWLLPLVYVAGRWFARRLVTHAFAQWVLESPPTVRRLGTGLLSQGSLPVALAVAVSTRFPEYSPLIMTTVLLGSIFSDLWSDHALTRLLADAGEVPMRGSQVPPPPLATSLSHREEAEEVVQ